MKSGEGSTMNNFIVCTDIIIVVKFRRLRWAEHVVRMEMVMGCGKNILS